MDHRVDLASFRTFGFVVLRRLFDADSLIEEIDRVMRDGLLAPSDESDRVGIRFRYVPMMTTETPVSLSLLDQLEAVAATLIGCPVIPTRAKGVLYAGDTPWHSDSSFPLASLGFAAYLESLTAGNGALRVLPGSHRPELAEALRRLGAAGAPAASLPAHAVATEPGDIIAFDEHLFHASAGGSRRRQWRLDYLEDPVGADAEENTRSYFRSIYPPDGEIGYDVGRFGSYGLDWRASGRPSVERLEKLGVYALADRHESRATEALNAGPRMA